MQTLKSSLSRRETERSKTFEELQDSMQCPASLCTRGICCQKLLLEGFFVSWHQCFVAVSATFPDASVLTLFSLHQAYPRPKPSKAFFLEGKFLGFVSGTFCASFCLGASESASCYRKFAATFSTGQRLPHHRII